MLGKELHAIVLMQTWGKSEDFIRQLKRDRHVISLFHIMGRYSYLLDTNFDNKNQLASWIDNIKSFTYENGIPAVLAIQTQRIIDALKQKKDFTLQDYLETKEKYHFFVEIDNPHHDENLVKLLEEKATVDSLLHIQGEYSFTCEVILEDYEEFKSLLKDIKSITSIQHIETFEVISVLKYRNQIFSQTQGIIEPKEDIRMLYTL